MVSSVSTKLMDSSSDSDVSSRASNISNLSDLKLGSRVGIGDDIGTVCYIGEIAGYTGTWLGIDWDDPSRGKHNGTVGEHTYFIAREENSASFVRPNKVSYGVSIVDALKKKYGQLSGSENEILTPEKLEGISKCLNAPFLELVGLDKIAEHQSDFKKLKIVGLCNSKINDSGDLKEFGKLCTNLQELDLSRNLITSLNTVFEICSELPHLKRLNLSDNRLTLPSTIPSGILPQVKIVILGGLNWKWHEIVCLCKVWPNVEELRAPFNNFTNFDTTEDIIATFRKLKALYLQNNPITSWQEITKLGVLDTLEKLILTECLIKDVEFPDCKPTEKTSLFKNLNCLSLTENLIDNWKSISELEKLQNLTELRTIKNPIDQLETLASRFQLIIARIGNLKNLNGTIILPEERRGAEYDYMKKYANEWIEYQKDPNLLNQFIERHPRYPVLVEKYGSPEEIASPSTSTSLKSNLIELELFYGDKKIIKQLPPGMLVQKLVTLVQRLFKLDFTPKLQYISGTEAKRCERDFDNLLKDLSFYSLQHGDQIIIKTE